MSLVLTVRLVDDTFYVTFAHFFVLCSYTIITWITVTLITYYITKWINHWYQQFTLYVRFTMALFFKNYSHAKLKYLLLRFKMAKYFLEYMTLEMVSEGEKMLRRSGKILNWLFIDASTTNKKEQQWSDNPSLFKKKNNNPILPTPSF